MDANTEFNMAVVGLLCSTINLGLDEGSKVGPVEPTSTGVIDNDGPKRVVTPLEDAATEEMVFIAGTGTTEAEIDLLARDTEIGRFDV